MRLIVGINSDIGRAIKNYWDEKNVSHHASTRYKELSTNTRPYIDLTDNFFLNAKNHYSTAIICAGITRLEICRQNPLGTRKINVEGTLRLARYLSEFGTQVIFLSTDKVYDGSKQYRNPDEPVSPITEYGRQKAEVEKSIAKLTAGVVLRVAKVVYPGQDLLSAWIDRLRHGKAISPFSDMWFSPVSMELICKIIDKLIEKKARGIWHASSAADITYETAARHIASCLGVDQSLINPYSYLNSDRVSPNEVPRYTSLDMKKTTDLGINASNPIDTIHRTICAANEFIE